MIIFYAIGEKDRAKELVRIITKTRWKTISKHAVKISSSSIGPTIVIFKPTLSGLAVAMWLKNKAEELGMAASVGWFTPITKVPEQIDDAINTDLNKILMKKLEVPWSPS
ncbi:MULTISPECIES: hypothetical protein [Acidianus]|uniref:Uncharacterized protein n=1 Tax=Candidatus Acidianus copahuensis TaxID=1160895 RepID=A0A031LKX1_9CREN|nr:MULTISPECIES: hypothetical protein [Acidianus]EZQ01834.1 hypothetical protein CM19_12250 [Candidatus Acidianus copahuensis]NON62276.1 hypothetical protein [Acidianus sp. RZ1]